MVDFFRKIHSDVRISAIFYGTLSSLLATLISNYSYSALTWLGKYSFGILKVFVDSRFAKAATLEPTNYSFLILVLVFIIVTVGWLEISGIISKALAERKDVALAAANKKQAVTPAWAPWGFLFIRVVIGTYLLYALLYLAGETTILNAITDFKQHMRIITPYIAESVRDQLISDWSQMRSVEDHARLYERIILIANENGLTLYKNNLH